MEKLETFCRIDVGRMPYQDLNRVIRSKIAKGFRHFVLERVVGQRYIGAGLSRYVVIEIYGVPGQDLGVFNGGAKLIVYGNAQDGVGNTMNDGFIIVHGNVGDIPGHMVRNGKIYIRGSAGFRAGIMMKEYGKKHPIMIVGETLGDYAGEYMVGGTLIVLGLSMNEGESPVARHIASGMFDGEIFVRGEVSRSQLGNGAVMDRAGSEHVERILPCLEEYAVIFGYDQELLSNSNFWLIRRLGQKPFGNLYVPSSATGRDVKPVHKNLLPPCAGACPAGIPNPLIIRYLREGMVEQAFDLIDDYTPFRYSCCGMVCPGLYRAACTRNLIGNPVKIDEIAKKYHPYTKVKVLEGKKRQKIAVIGAGPSGISAAWHLARRGYRVEVYEKQKDIGGKLTPNIPEERLSRKDVDKDLSRIRSLDIKFFTDKEVDGELFKNIRKKYDAVILEVGAQKPRTIGFIGEEKAVPGFYFLRTVKKEI